VTVIHADGSRETLQKVGLVCTDDVIATGNEAGAGIILPDGHL
jgi:hypothetical protein